MGSNNSKQIGMWIVTSLVIGNMIGSGIFMLPSSLAELGGISIFGWIASGVGAIAIAMVFGRLSKLVLTGGPYVYPKEGFGDFIGFFSGCGYWMSVLLTIFSLPAFAFSVWAVFGSGQEIVFYGFIILICGVPLYVYSKMKKNKVYQ